MPRVLLVNPPWSVLLGMSSASVHLGLVSVAASLKAAGHEVAVFNPDLFGSPYVSELDVLKANESYMRRLQDVSDPVWLQVRQQIQQFGPDVVGVHVKTPSWTSGCMVARISKEVNPHVLTVCGGPHVTCAPEDVVPASGFDYAIRGEGEKSMTRLIDAGTDESRVGIPGVISSGRKSRSNESWTMIENLDELPLDGRDTLMDMDRYDKLGLGAIMTARGCPSPCTFCASPKIWGRKVRYRSPENVLAEIDLLTRHYGVTYFRFCDDTFTVNRRRVQQICDLLIERHPHVRWTCTTRCDCIDSELLATMKRAGCSGVSVGVESASPRILDAIEKGETREQIAEGCRLLRSIGIPFVTFIMIGFPTETVEEAWETLGFARDLGADSLCGSVVTPYLGTRMYDWALQRNKVPQHHNWREYYHQSGAMGLWDVEPARAKRAIEEWFKQIEIYNQRPSRLLRRFLSQFQDDPLGIVRRAGSVLRRKLLKH